MLSSKNRFHRRSSLKYVFRNGRQARTGGISIKAVKNSRRSTPRVAVVVSKKTLKRAVARNRVRRRIYEIIRSELPTIDQTTDLIVVVTSPEILTISHQELTGRLKKMLLCIE